MTVKVGAGWEVYISRVVVFELEIRVIEQSIDGLEGILRNAFEPRRQWPDELLNAIAWIASHVMPAELRQKSSKVGSKHSREHCAAFAKHRPDIWIQFPIILRLMIGIHRSDSVQSCGSIVQHVALQCPNVPERHQRWVAILGSLPCHGPQYHFLSSRRVVDKFSTSWNYRVEAQDIYTLHCALIDVKFGRLRSASTHGLAGGDIEKNKAMISLVSSNLDISVGV